MKRRIAIALAAMLLAAGALPYGLGDVEPDVLDASARASAPGAFAILTDGSVRYDLSGPPDGPPVVLVHGFASYAFVWEPLVPLLERAGVRVLRYDLFGRGYSDRPHRAYDGDLMDRQLRELLDAVGIRQPINLVGLSMGGAISAVFTARHPQRVRRLALLAPAGVRMPPPRLARVARLPVLGEWMMRLQRDADVMRQSAAQLYHPPLAARFTAPFPAQLRFQGYRRALLSTLRHYPLFDLDDTFAAIGRRGRPALAVWGRDDAVLPVANLDALRAYIPQLQAHVLERAGHLVVFEEPERVAPLLLDFFTKSLDAN
jgi:pimeloyl-ACP methyl ester carboxylesterase